MFNKWYKYVHFLEVENPSGKTHRFVCRNNKCGSHLGHIAWFAPWRQYCYFATEDAVYSVGCLDDIHNFIGHLMRNRLEAVK